MLTAMLRLLIVLTAAVLWAAPASAQTADVLPDLDQMVPIDLGVKARTVGHRRVFHLGFASAAANVGAGPLTLHGYRRTRRVNRMHVDQIVDQSSGPGRLIRDVGVMSYVVHPDHHHWHLLGFERYEIRSADGQRPLARDHKMGFCLGDRFALPHADTLPAFVPVALQGDTCGLGQPGLTGLFAGISVGWADRYDANIEGQYIDVTHLASGTYVLVHRLNTNGRLAESNYTNNASSVRFRLRWRRDRRRPPRVRVLRECAASDVCPPRRARPKMGTRPY